MGDDSKIEWTDATWNPVTGCSHVSPGCEHCYAETLSLRYGWTKQPWGAQHAAENVVLHPERLEQPLKWKRPRRIFVNSMSDLFHENVPDEFIERVFGVMALAKQHVFQVLTKRPDRMRRWFETMGGLEDRETCVARAGESMGFVFDSRGSDPDNYIGIQPYRVPDGHGGYRPRTKEERIAAYENRRPWPGWPLPNVWLGVSVEDQRRADERVPLLLQTPAAVRFLSIEPLLEAVNLVTVANTAGLAEGQDYLNALDGYAWTFRGCDYQDSCRIDTNLDWVIVGGESGPQHRDMHIEWLIDIVSQCQAAQVPLFVKQDSGPRAGMKGRIPDDLWIKEYPA